MFAHQISLWLVLSFKTLSFKLFFNVRKNVKQKKKKMVVTTMLNQKKMYLPSTLESYVIVYSKVKDKIKHCGIFYDVFSQQL